MPINADKPQLWKADTRASVDQFNQWFMKFAPKAYRETRKKTIESVETGLRQTQDLTAITPDIIKANPAIVPMLRMSTCPPLARDRLIGLADSSKNLVGTIRHSAGSEFKRRAKQLQQQLFAGDRYLYRSRGQTAGAIPGCPRASHPRG